MDLLRRPAEFRRFIHHLDQLKTNICGVVRVAEEDSEAGPGAYVSSQEMITRLNTITTLADLLKERVRNIESDLI